MCGIAGFVGPSWHPEQLRAMAAAQTHRGPDDTGFIWAEGDDFPEMGPCGLASNRLAIIDPTPAGNMPMFGGKDGNWLVLVHNGEIYNYRELRVELSDYTFRTDTDTEVILAAYDRWGADCVKHFNGMFAFAIWDGVRQELFCARDRLGQKPFYWAWIGGNFVFASEIKALLATGYPVVPNSWDIDTYLRDGLVDDQMTTWFGGIVALKPGHTMTFDPETQQTKYEQYWRLPTEQVDLTDAEAHTDFMHLLMDSVRLRLRSDVPLAVNASGGLDSNAILAICGPPTYTCKMQKTGIAHLEKAVRALEHPLGSLETLGYFNHHRTVAEEGIKVVLDGNGADEILGGYPWHDPSKPLRPQLERDLLSTKLPRVLRMNDRLSMAHGVELRSPFLDYRLVEFCFSLPDRFKIRDGHGKWLLRYAMDDWRPKVQQTDTLALLIGPLRLYVEEIINSPEFVSRGLWDASTVQSDYRALCEVGAGQEHDRAPAPIWRYISTELWFREFVDNAAKVREATQARGR